MNRLRLFATIPPIVSHLTANLSGRRRVAVGRVASQLHTLFENEAAAMACSAITIRRPPRNVRTMLRMTRRWSSCAVRHAQPASPLQFYSGYTHMNHQTPQPHETETSASDIGERHTEFVVIHLNTSLRFNQSTVGSDRCL